jgi:Protein of unknown function DUF262
MKKWISSPHPISDVVDWQRLGRLEIKPDFQRNAVWSDTAKIMLIDTILQNMPMPKIFVSTSIKDRNAHRAVIDGQQRITAILSFLNDDFSLDYPYAGEYKNHKYSQLPESVQTNILQYSIDFNEAYEYSELELRDIYSRLNKYSVALNKQELRKADYPGQFLQLSEEFSLLDFFDDNNFFSTVNRRRLADVEYISELIAGLVDGPQDKKDTLDSFYLKYQSWDSGEVQLIRARFLDVIGDIETLFGDRKLRGTRFKQKSDFYSLFLAIDKLRQAGGRIDGLNFEFLSQDLDLLNQMIEPESGIRDFRTYAIQCVSQSNTLGARLWRQQFLESFLVGAYLKIPPKGDQANLLTRIYKDLSDDSFCAGPEIPCAICHSTENQGTQFKLGWLNENQIYQLSNLELVHAKCATNIPFIELASGDNHLAPFEQSNNDMPP